MWVLYHNYTTSACATGLRHNSHQFRYHQALGQIDSCATLQTAKAVT